MHVRRGEMQAPPYARLSLDQAAHAWFIFNGEHLSVRDAGAEQFAAWYESQVQRVTADDPPKRRLSSQWRNQMSDAAEADDPDSLDRLMWRWWALDALLDEASKRQKCVEICFQPER